MELVGHVGQAFAALPPNRGELLVGQGLGHEHVVVHRHGVELVALEQRREHVRAQCHALSGHDATLGRELHRGVGRAVESLHGGALVNLHADLRRMASELCGKLRGVQVGVLAGRELATEEGRRVDTRLHLSLVEQLNRGVVALTEPLHLVRSVGHGDHAVVLEVDVELVVLDELRHRVEVLVAQTAQNAGLVGPARFGVGLAVGDARLTETAVAARGRPADLHGFEQHDATLGVRLLQLDRGPQTGVAAAHNHVVDALIVHQYGVACSLVSYIFCPEATKLSLGQGVLNDLRCGPVCFKNGGFHGVLVFDIHSRSWHIWDEL